MFWDKKKILVTHNGGFHSDDIFACATLQIYLEQKGEVYKIVRSHEEQEILKGDFVFDVGGVYDPKIRRFDHHQKGGAGSRVNGVPYAAFGLVWKEFGEILCGNDKEVANEIDRKIVQPIDSHDNGLDVYTSKIENVSPLTFQDIVGTYYPEENAEDEEYYNIFLELVLLAKEILKNSIQKTKKQFEVNNYVKNLYESSSDKKVVVVDRKYGRFALTVATVNLPEVLYVVYPSKRDDGEWNILATRKNIESMESKKPFPESWGGLRDTELQKVTGVKTAKFCHNGRFLSVARNKEDAILLANLAIKS